jgi:hypothetical protein
MRWNLSYYATMPRQYLSSLTPFQATDPILDHVRSQGTRTLLQQSMFELRVDLGETPTEHAKMLRMTHIAIVNGASRLVYAYDRRQAVWAEEQCLWRIVEGECSMMPKSCRRAVDDDSFRPQRCARVSHQ